MNDPARGAQRPASMLQLTRTVWRRLPSRLQRGWLLLVILGAFAALLESSLAWMLWQALNSPASVALAAAMTALIVARLGLRFAELLYGETIAEHTITHLGQLLLERFFRGGWLNHQQGSSQELMQRVHDDSELIAREGFLALAWSLSEALTTMVLISALVVIAGPLILVPAAALLVMSALAVWLVHARFHRWSQRNHENWLRLRRHVLQMFAGTRELLVSGQAGDFLEHNLALRSACTRLRREGASLRHGSAMAMESFFLLLILLMLLIAPDAGATALFAVYAGLRLLPAMLKSVRQFGGWMSARASFDAVARDLQAPTVIDPDHSRAPGNEVRLVETHDAGVRYGPTEIFGQACLQWCAGEWIAVCGPTGSGKTTLLHLVAGLLEPVAGSVRVDGRSMDQARAAWWSTMGLVPQEPFVFEDNLYANLVLRPGAQMAAAGGDQAEREALRIAGLGDWPDALEQGWQTVLGESGARLSGGQRQRLALARVLLARPAWLILDEPSAALDAASEAGLIARIKAMDPPVSVLVASHREAWLQACDAVVSVQDGRLMLQRNGAQVLDRPPATDP